jgi:hypothetical protein
MALYHVHADVISKGKAVGGSAGFAQYLTRTQGPALNHAQYLGRESHPAKDDLVEKGYDGLPSWAKDGVYFFQMADRYSHKNATLARTYEIALPRELHPDERNALAADIRATFFERYPHLYAIHNPLDAQQREYPHMHLMVSERRARDEIVRGPKQYFQYAAASGRDPATGGVGTDRSWQGPARLRELRAGVATLTNAALERAGVEAAVSHRSLKAQGHDREPCIYTQTKDKARVETIRETLHRDYHPWENDLNLAAWHEQKRREGVRDVSREALIDHVRDRFWQQDHSPAREQEREASLLRAIEREYVHTGRERVQPSPHTHEWHRTPAQDQAREWYREPERDLDKPWDKPLIGNKKSQIYHTPDQANYGDVNPQNQERFWTERAALAAGYRRAANDHYGPGTGIAREEQEWQARRRVDALAQGHRRGTNGRLVVDGNEDRMHAGVHVEIETQEREHSHA